MVDQKRATVKYASIALEDTKTYRSRAVGRISTKGETGDFVGAVMNMARTRDSNTTGCPDQASKSLPLSSRLQ